MGTMPSPALLPTIQLMDQQAAGDPVDPHPTQAPTENPQSPLQPAPCMAIPLPQPQPASQPPQQPLPQAAPLPTATANPSTPAQVLVPAGLYLVHGVMPLPQRLLTKILNLEFVEMQDILPEAWLTLIDNDTVKCCSASATGGRKRHHPHHQHTCIYMASGLRIPHECAVYEVPHNGTRIHGVPEHHHQIL